MGQESLQTQMDKWKIFRKRNRTRRQKQDIGQRPSVTRGAVSPMARDIARIIPVMIFPKRPARPGDGSSATWCPRGRRGLTDRSGAARSASRVARMMTARSKAKVVPPARTLRSSFIIRTKPQPEDPVNHGRDAGKVRDVDFDKIGEAVFARVFLQINPEPIPMGMRPGLL